MKKPSTLMRVPVEWENLVKRWNQQAREAGYGDSMTDIQRNIAVKLKPYKYRPDLKEFKIHDLYDELYPVRRRGL